MPPKAKFTKEQIIYAALKIARRDGINAVTARELGSELGSSARPIFTVFQSMDEVQHEIRKAAKEIYKNYINKGLSEVKSFKGVGTAYIQFAQKESKLFQLLFMEEIKTSPSSSDVLSVIEENYEEILLSVEKLYNLDKENAYKLYKHLWIYTHGIATLCATKVCVFKEEEISEMITEVCLSILHRMKAGEVK